MAVAALILLDLVFRALWHPHPTRLPEQFSTPYLNAYIDAERGAAPVLVLGDSALWGYELPATAAPVERLASGSYEGEGASRAATISSLGREADLYRQVGATDCAKSVHAAILTLEGASVAAAYRQVGVPLPQRPDGW